MWWSQMVSPYSIAIWSAVIGGFQSSLFWQEVLPLAVTIAVPVSWWQLCFLTLGIHTSQVSVPLSLLMLLEWSHDSVPMGVLITGRSSGCTLNGKGLSTGSGELNLLVMLLDSFVHQSYSFPIICKLCSIHRESCNHATLHSQVDRVFQSHQVWPLFGVSIVVADGGKVAPITLKILSPQCHGRYGLRHELCIRGWSPLIWSGFVSTELIWRS